MDWQIQELKDGISAIFGLYILESLNTNLALVNKCTHFIFVPVSPRRSLLMIIK